MLIGAMVVGGLLSLVFLGAGGAKLAGAPAMRESARHLKLPFASYRVIGALEVCGAVGLIVGVWPGRSAEVGLGLAAAAGLFALMLGAIFMHARAGDKPAQWAPVLVFAVLAVAYFGLRVA